MADRALHHRRVHNLLLFQKLLSLREGASPFTLVLDTIEQAAKPLLRHFIKNAKAANIHTLFISFETPATRNMGINTTIRGPGKPIPQLGQEIRTACSAHKRTLLLIDSLHPFCSSSHPIAAILTPLIAPTVSVVGVYHTDIPLPSPTSLYAPSALTTLRYLATTILTLHSMPQTVATKQASDSAKPEPLFGLREYEEGREGVLVGLSPSLSPSTPVGGMNQVVVVAMEHRRRSGRAVEETFILPPTSSDGKILLLEDHPLYRKPTANAEEDQVVEGTFKLGLSEKERRDREGVVLPYYDAQRREMGGGEGEGQGGRIIYEMGVEDDFDEEEDEI